MKITLLSLLLVVTDAHLEPGNTYHYDYEAVTFTGFPHAGLARAGIKIKAKAVIEKISGNEAIINLRKAQVHQYLGEWPAGSFRPAPRVEEPLVRQLQNPVKFIYNEGDVGRIYASPEMSDTAVNIVRGVLNLFQVVPSKNKRSFDIQEAGIQGVCQTRYIRQESSSSDKIVIIKARNLNNCTKNATLTTGAAYTEACPACEKISKNVQSAATIRISLQKSRSLGEVIHRVKSTEVHAFSPFHNQEGAAMTETKQTLELEEVSRSSNQPIRSSSMQERGGIMYMLPQSAIRKLSPLVLAKRGNLEAEIESRLKLLSENSRGVVQSDAPLHFITLVSLLRTTSASLLRNVWRHSAQSAEYRRWFLDALPAIGTLEVIEFLETAINRQEITESEASTTLFMTLHTQEASADAVTAVQKLLNNKKIRQSPALRKTMLLGYGSLVRRHCVHLPSCPEAMLSPLHEMLRESIEQGKENKAILAIKAIANAGQQQSLTPLQRCMPSWSAPLDQKEATIPTQAEAIIALRSIAKKSPAKVAGMALRVLLDHNVHAGLRIHSCISLLETRPSIAVLTLVAQRLQAENTLQLPGFFYSHLRTLSRSSVPELRNLAIISNIASKIMSPNFDRLSYRYSKAVHFDAFSVPGMAGAAADVYMINGGSDIIPNSVDVKVRGYFLDHAADVVEVQLHSGGLNELLFRKPFPGEDPASVRVDSSVHSTLQKLDKWKSMYRQVPLAAAELKIFGQNVAFGSIGEEKITALMEILGRLQSRTSSVRSVVKYLQDGFDGTVGKGYLMAEVHRLVPVSIGIPLDVAITLAGVANMQAFVHAKFPSTLPADLKLQDILSSEMEMQATGSASFSKHLHAVMALSTEMFQVGLQSSTTFRGQLPLDATARFSVRDSNFKITTNPPTANTEIARMRTETKAFIRDLAATKTVSVLPERNVPTTSGSSSFESTGVHYFSSEAKQSAESSSEAWPSNPHVRMPNPIPQPSSSAEDVDSVEVPFKDSFVFAKPVTRRMEACINFTSIPRKLCVSSTIRSATYIQNTLLYKLIGPMDAKIVLKQNPNTEFSSALRSMEMEIQTGLRSAEKIDIGLVRMPSSNTTQSWESSEENEGVLESILKRIHGLFTDENEYAPFLSSSSSKSSDSDFTSGSRSRGVNRMGRKPEKSSSSSSYDRSSISIEGSDESSRAPPHSGGRAWPQGMFSGSTESSQEQSVLSLFKLSKSTEEHSQSSSSSSSSSESNSISINVPSSDRESPSAVVIMRALYENGETSGLQTGVFYSYSPRKDRYKVHTVVASIGNRDSWKLCTEMESSCARAKAIVAWGKECSQYAVEARVASGKIDHHPAARLDFKWARVPTWVKVASRIAYDCSVITAYNLGMTEIARSNPPRKISITVAALSPRILDAIVKFPEVTWFKQGVILPAVLGLQKEIAFGEETGMPGDVLQTGQMRPGPFDCWGLSSTSEALLNSTNAFIQDPAAAECHVRNNTVQTFDGVRVPFNGSKNCRHVLSQHCVPEMSFVIMLKPVSEEPYSLSLEMHLGDTKVVIESVHGKLTPRVNNQPMDYKTGPHSFKGINITKEKKAIVVKAEPFGVKRLVFDGNNCTVRLSTWMRGQVCGMCGHADSERNTTYRMPSHKLAKDSESFMQSWVLMEDGCGGECPLQRKSVKLAKPNAWPHSGDRCYSTEPVFRCPRNCTPTSKQNVTVGMHCLPSDWSSEGRLEMMSNKREDLPATVEAHKGCKA